MALPVPAAVELVATLLIPKRPEDFGQAKGRHPGARWTGQRPSNKWPCYHVRHG
jgi:hypothetical protein